MNNISISVITVTLNCEKDIVGLIISLESQKDKNFTWIVQDGVSTDRTTEIISQVDIKDVKVISGPDSGIYDAMNRAIDRCLTDYYLVVGADDRLDSDAIANYRRIAVESQPDFVAMGVRIGKNTLFPKKGYGWLYGMYGESSCHSVGLLIKRELHDRYGAYNKQFSFVADQLFVKTCLKDGASIEREHCVAGNFASGGYSSINVSFLLFEFALMQLLTEKNKLLQIFILTARLIKNLKYFRSP